MNDQLLAPFMPEDVKKLSSVLGTTRPLALMDFMLSFIKISGTFVARRLLRRFYRL
jgi:hypothetical protein